MADSTEPVVDFRTSPERYRHWKLTIENQVAHLVMDVDEQGGLRSDYELKLNSYDLGVDIELADAVQRLRFEHPEVRAVVLRSAKDKVFCAGANIRMLASSSHAHKVNFCKFTNETRASIEEASAASGQRYLAAVEGACAGGGYELALAADRILLVDDGSSAVSLPEVPLLAVLPGTGGLTRLTDKRKLRPDRADVFCTTEEGVRGARAVTWGLVDAVASPSRFEAALDAQLSLLLEEPSPKAASTVGAGIELTPLERVEQGRNLTYSTVDVDVEAQGRWATLRIRAPTEPPPTDGEAFRAKGARAWLLRLARELDDALLHLRLNEPEVGLLLLETMGDARLVLAHDAFLHAHRGHWLVREAQLFINRVFARLELSARSTFALVRPGSCFVGLLAELVFASDRSYMADGPFEEEGGAEAFLTLTESSFGPFPTLSEETRLERRFRGTSSAVGAARARVGETLSGEQAESLGLITSAFDDVDWEDEVRLALEERASFSPDALTGLEANLRFGGPETMATKIFGRLTAWQNWIFQRPNAVGEDGALRRYGTGQRAGFDRRRV